MAAMARGGKPSSSGWSPSLDIEHTPLNTTGGHTWKAAYYLFDYFAAAGDGLAGVAPHAGIAAPGVRVVELGAGCGWLGMNLAANLPGLGALCMTEQAADGGMDWLDHNLRRNQARCNLGAVTTSTCDWTFYRDHSPGAPWGEGAELAGAPGAARDLIYNEVGANLLPVVIRALSKPSTVTYYCHTKHRYTHLDIEFLEALEACGLTWEEVRAPGVDTPPPSPDPMERILNGEIFPDQRIVVFKIRLK